MNIDEQRKQLLNNGYSVQFYTDEKISELWSQEMNGKLKYKDKYSLDVELCGFYAQNTVADYLWKSMHMEGIAITYRDAHDLCEGKTVQGLSVEDVIVANNLKHAWLFMLDALWCETDCSFICELNRKIGDNVNYLPGVLVNKPMIIDKIPLISDLPIKLQVQEELDCILRSKKSKTEIALDLLAYITIRNLFADGNKRTAILVANHYLIRNGVGLLSISIEDQLKFCSILLSFYESGDSYELKRFLYDNCISSY